MEALVIMPDTGIPSLPIGYPEVSEVYLAAHESTVSEGLTFRFSSNGWAHDWIVEWNRAFTGGADLRAQTLHQIERYEQQD